MPDILSPILDIQSPSIPNIDTVPDVPKWNLPSIEVPPSLQNTKSVFDQIPQKDIDTSDFNDIINKGIAPQQTKEQLDNNQILNSIEPNIRTPQVINPEFRAFKTSTAQRYKQNPRLWRDIGFNPELPTNITDAMYDHNETTWESVKNVFPKFWETAAFQFKQYFAEYADTAKAIGTLDMNVLHDANRFKTYSQRLQDIENIYPDYATDKETKWWQLYRGDFWEESGSSLGFTVGTIGAALLENVAITLATEGIGEVGELYNTPRKVFKSISDYYSLRRAYGLARAAVGAKNIVGKFEAGVHLWRLMNGALAEAAYEGFNTKNDYVNQWKSNFVQTNGRQPNKEELDRAISAGNKMANATVLFETPFLLASNAAQFGNLIYGKSTPKIFGAYGKYLTRFFGDAAKDSQLYKYGIDAAGKTIVEDLPKEKFFPKLLEHAKNAIWEGTEESYQALVTKSTADYYNDKEFNKDQASLFKSLGVGFDYLRTNTGMKEFSAGFATGAIFEHVGKPLHFLVKPNQVVDEKTGDISYKTNIFNTYLNLGMKSASAVMERQKMEKVAKALNAVDLNNMLKEDGIFSLIKDKRTALHMANYLKNNDMFNVQNIKSLQLMRFLYAGLVNGKIDHQISKLSQFSNGTFDSVKQYFGLDENEFDTKEKQDNFMNNFKAFTNDLHGKTAEFEKIYSTEKTKYQKIINKSDEEFENARRQHNNLIDKIKDKYNIKPEDDLDPDKISKEDFTALQMTNLNLQSKIYSFYGINEGVKAAVFAQAGMKEDAKHADQIVRDLNNEDPSGIKYGFELGQIFDKSYRDKRLTDLKSRLSLATDPADKQKIQDQLAPFEKLTEELNNNFDNGSDYKKYEISNLIQRYLHATQKESNPDLKLRSSDERGYQQEKLSQFVELQRRHQDNLHLLNQLSEDNQFSEYSNNESAKLRDFFYSAVDLAEKYDDQERLEQKQKEAELSEKKAAEVKPEEIKKEETKSQEAPQTQEEKKKSSVNDSDLVKRLISAIKSGDQGDIERAKELIKDVSPELLYKFRNSGIIKPEIYDPVLKDIIGEKKFTEMYDDGVLKNKNARSGSALKDVEGKKADIERRRQEAKENPVPEPISYKDAVEEYKSTDLGSNEDAKRKKQRVVNEAQTKEGRAFVENQVAQLETNDDGTITVYRSGTMQEGHNPATTDKKVAEVIASERKKQGLSSDIIEVRVQPTDISAVIPGIESEVFIKINADNKNRISDSTKKPQKTKNQIIKEKENVKIELDEVKQKLLTLNKDFKNGKFPFSEEVYNETKTRQEQKIKNLEWQLAKYDAELATLEETSGVSGSALKDKKADIERRRQEELDNLFSKTQVSTDKRLNTPVQKLSKEEVSKNIEIAKQQNKDLIEELENPEFLNDEKRNDEWDKKADELSDKLPQGVSFRITDGKVDFFDSQSYREKGFGKNIVQVLVNTLHNQTEKFEVGDNLQVDDGVRAIPAIVTKVNEHGKILEAKEEDGRIIISRGNIITLAPINDRLKINAKYDAEYVDAVKKGEMTKEQAMQALEEIGRKDSSAYLEIDNTGKEGVKELFEQNPELANAVYEALGFKTESSSNTITRDIKEELPFKVMGNYNEIDEGLIGRKFYEEKIGNDLYRFEISNYSYPNEDGSSESFYDIDFTVNGSEEVIGTGFFDKAERAKQILQALLSQNFGNDTVRFNVEESKKGKQRLSLYKRLMNQLGYNPSGEMEYALFYDIKTDKVNLTPQQKQQAQQLYAQYLSQNPNGSVEGFKAWKAEYDAELDALEETSGVSALISDTGIKSDEATVNQAVKTSTEKANDFTNDIEAQKKALEEAKGKTPEQAEDEFDPNC